MMATETIIEIEIETVVDDLTDHEFDICCDLGGWDGDVPTDCPDPARWAMTRACCGTVALACDTCKDERMANTISVKCGGCGAVFFDAPAAYLYIQPLGKS